MTMSPSTMNPNSSLPNRPNQEKLSIPEFNKKLAEVDEQATRLSAKANSIWKKNNPDDMIKTGIFDKKDFIRNNEIFIPEEAQELFDEDERNIENKRIEQEERIKAEVNDRIRENEAKADNNEETSVEDLQRQLGGIGKKQTKEHFDESKVKKHPILSKLKEKFGIKEQEQAYISKVINDVKITFEFPSALTTNFAMAIATGEGIGSFDFANAFTLANCAMSIVAFDDVSVSEIFVGVNKYSYDNIPAKLRKLCGFEVMQFLQKMPQDELENILSYFRNEIGTEEFGKNESENILELECPNCGATRTVPIDEKGKYDIRYCDRCGTKLIPTNTTETDGNLPLA